MDGDGFSRATRLGRAAAQAVGRAASADAPFDGFSTARLIDHVVELSGGIASLPSILSVLGELGSAPRLGNGMFHVYETGIECLNVPTSSAQVASRGTAKEVDRDLFAATR